MLILGTKQKTEKDTEMMAACYISKCNCPNSYFITSCLSEGFLRKACAVYVCLYVCVCPVDG